MAVPSPFATAVAKKRMWSLPLLLGLAGAQRRLAEDHQCASVAFAPHTIVDTADNAASVFAVDVDGDGDLDVLSASSSDDTVAWYDDDGAVSFTTRIVSRLVNYARSVYASDVDGDGDVDVVAVAYYARRRA